MGSLKDWDFFKIVYFIKDECYFCSGWSFIGLCEIRRD